MLAMAEVVFVGGVWREFFVVAVFIYFHFPKESQFAFFIRLGCRCVCQ